MWNILKYNIFSKNYISHYYLLIKNKVNFSLKLSIFKYCFINTNYDWIKIKRLVLYKKCIKSLTVPRHKIFKADTKLKSKCNIKMENLSMKIWIINFILFINVINIDIV